METIKTNKGEFLLIQIPESCVRFVCDMGYFIYKEPNYDTWIKDEELLSYSKCIAHLKKCEGKEEWNMKAIKLPDGDFKFIAVTKSFVLNTHQASQNLTEEIAAQIVGDNGMGCYDNYRLKKDEKYTCESAMDSFQCLLATSGIDTKLPYAILKKLNTNKI